MTGRPWPTAPDRVLLFDLDGVLADSVDAWHATLDALRRRRGLPPVPRAEMIAAFGGSVADDVDRFFEGALTTEALSAMYEAEFPEHATGIRALEPDLAPLLDRLRTTSWGMAVTTNAPRSTAYAMLDAVGVRDRFDVIVTTDDVPAPKPAPDMLLEACRHLDAPVARALLVGDSPTDVAAAEAAEIAVAGYRTDAAPRRIESLAELLTRAPG